MFKVVVGAAVGCLIGVLPWLGYRYGLGREFDWRPFAFFTALACFGALIGAIAGATQAIVETLNRPRP